MRKRNCSGCTRRTGSRDPPSAEPMPLLDVQHLAIAYGDAPAVWDASLQVDEGQLVSVIGPNGAGKSTLVNTIAGLHRARSGELRFDGVDLTAVAPHLVCRCGI